MCVQDGLAAEAKKSATECAFCLARFPAHRALFDAWHGTWGTAGHIQGSVQRHSACALKLVSQ